MYMLCSSLTGFSLQKETIEFIEDNSLHGSQNMQALVNVQ